MTEELEKSVPVSGSEEQGELNREPMSERAEEAKSSMPRRSRFEESLFEVPPPDPPDPINKPGPSFRRKIRRQT